MKVFLFLLPLLCWAYLPQTEMIKLADKYKDGNHPLVISKTYKDQPYFIIVSVEEKIFKEDTLEEEKPFLKAGIRQALFNHMKQTHPKIKTIEVSGLLVGTFWESTKYFHHIAQVKEMNVKAISSSKIKFQEETTTNTKEYTKTTPSLKKLDVTVKTTDRQKLLQNKIVYLEEKFKEYPKNKAIVERLSELYKDLGDVDGYESATERLMNLKMEI